MNLDAFPVAATVAVSDLDRARRFYEGTLGLSPDAAVPEGLAGYPCGGGTQLLVYPSRHAGTATATVATFMVDDVEAAVAGLADRGVVFERYDEPGIETDARGIAGGPGMRVAWFRDPDGNTIAVAGP